MHPDRPAQGAAEHTALGNDLVKQGRLDEALAEFAKAVATDPGDAGAYLGRGRAWYRKYDYQRAVEDFSKAIELDAGLERAYFNRGLAWRARGKSENAVADYDRAIELDPGHAVAYLQHFEVSDG